MGCWTGLVFSLFASFLLSSESLATLVLAFCGDAWGRLGAAFLGEALNGDRDLDGLRREGLRMQRDGVRARRSPIPLPPALPLGRSSTSRPSGCLNQHSFRLQSRPNQHTVKWRFVPGGFRTFIRERPRERTLEEEERLVDRSVLLALRSSFFLPGDSLCFVALEAFWGGLAMLPAPDSSELSEVAS
mmetsp:Transcript_63406/g.151517  ORF Transcript_63406/g.151517 Transcript_63406/m.151517 type:complete len:187 (+) Transcript_63406:814-1374(+)